MYIYNIYVIYALVEIFIVEIFRDNSRAHSELNFPTCIIILLTLNETNKHTYTYIENGPSLTPEEDTTKKERKEKKKEEKEGSCTNLKRIDISRRSRVP